MFSRAPGVLPKAWGVCVLLFSRFLKQIQEVEQVKAWAALPFDHFSLTCCAPSRLKKLFGLGAEQCGLRNSRHVMQEGNR